MLLKKLICLLVTSSLLLPSLNITYADEITSNGESITLMTEDSSTVPYAVEGGNIYYSATSGAIVSADKEITAAIIPTYIDGVQISEIFSGAFMNCNNLKKVTLPNSVKIIRCNAFSDCSSLMSISLGSVTEIDFAAFSGCSSLNSINIPNGIDKIDGYMFSGCANLTSISIPSSVESIGDGAFSKCKALNNITLPNNVKSIGSFTFMECESLEKITIPENTESIGNWTFANCKKLATLSLPQNIKNIGNYTFYNCSALCSIGIPSEIEYVGESAFRQCTSLKNITIPNNVKSIGNGAFAGCSILEKITLPESVESIGESAFAACKKLSSIYIPKKVKSIEDTTFGYCGSIIVEIPNSVTTIADNAFLNCDNPSLLCEANSYAETYAKNNNISYKRKKSMPNDVGLLPATSIELGDYITMGNYLGQDILWRCVGFDKIIGYDSDGNPIIDATKTSTEYMDGYLPLIISDKILCIKSFDALGSDTRGSHNRGLYDENTQGYYRQVWGSNYWSDSNIHDWLNSTASAGNVIWSCGNPPDSEHVYKGYNAYDNESGFLYNFSPTERNLIKQVNQKTLLDSYEYSKGSTNIEDPDYHIYNPNISNVIQNYSTAFCENTLDKVFLLDVQQLSNIYKNLGDYYKAKYTETSVSTSENLESYTSMSNYGYYWLRTPYNNYHSDRVRRVDANGSIGDTDACNARHSFGVRPAFYLDGDNAVLYGGDGDENTPYSILPNDNSKNDIRLIADIIGRSEIEYDKEKNEYSADSFKLYVSAKKQTTITNFNDKDNINTCAKIKLIAPKGFSFSKNETETTKEIYTPINVTNEVNIYLQLPTEGRHDFIVEVANSTGYVVSSNYEINITKDGFNEDIYRANYNITNGIAVKNIEDSTIKEDTPAEIIEKEANENGMENRSYWWDAWNKSINAVDDPSKILDYAFEEKDMYKAMIFDMLDCKIENKIDDFISNKDLKKIKKFEGTVYTVLKDYFTYDELTNGFFTDKDKKRAMELIKNRFKVDFPEIEEMNDGFDAIFDGFEYAGNYFEMVDQICANYMIYSMDNSVKQMLNEMYFETLKTQKDNIALKDALFEIKCFMESSEKEIMYRVSKQGIEMAGKDAAQHVVKEIWKKAKNKAYEASPALAIAHAIIKSGQFISETLFNTSGITEAYYKIVAVNDLGSVVNAAYLNQKNNFIEARTEYCAKNYNTAINILGAYYILNCDTTKKFPDAVENGAISKIFGVENSKELKEAINNIKTSMKSTVDSANTEWIEALAVDWPEFYNYYEKNRDKYKVYEIHCPVDVYVFDSNDILVGSVVRDSIYYDGKANITIVRYEDQKTVYTYGDEYKIVYKATDNGSMDIVVNEYSDDEKIATVNFNNVPLVKDIEYLSEESGDYSTNNNYILKQSNKEVLPDYDSTKNKAKHKLKIELGIIADSATQSGEFCEGEKIKIIAYLPENAKFLGWKSNADDNIFDDTQAISTIITMPDEDVDIVAEIEKSIASSFKTVDDKPHIGYCVDESNSSLYLLYMIDEAVASGIDKGNYIAIVDNDENIIKPITIGDDGIYNNGIDGGTDGMLHTIYSSVQFPDGSVITAPEKGVKYMVAFEIIGSTSLSETIFMPKLLQSDSIDIVNISESSQIQPLKYDLETKTEESTETSTETTSEESTETSTEAISEESTETSTEATSEESTETSTEATSEESTETSTEATSKESTETSTEVTSEESTETSTETTSEESTETSTEATSEESTETSTEVTSEESTETSTETTSEESTETSTEAASEESTETSTEATSEESTEQPFEVNNGEIIGYSGDEEIVEIPKEIGGKPITSVGDDFLKDNDTVRDVVLPDTIEKISPKAMNNVEIYCNFNSVTSINLKKSNIIFNYIGDIDNNGTLETDDINKVLDFVRSSDNSKSNLTEKEQHNAKIVSQSDKITATTAAKIFYLMNKYK